MKEKNYKTIQYKIEGRVAKLVLNRPQVHNAFNSTMISEMLDVLKKIQDDASIRIVVLTGNGKSFCAGADLNWMREVIDYSYDQNLKESLDIAEFLYNLYSIPKPTIAKVNGAAIGGGVGFLSACDIVLASSNAQFGLSEVKIGLIPAAISPYVVKRIGESKAREYFLTGERISAERGEQIGLVNHAVPAELLEQETEKTVDRLLSSGPNAIANCKKLLFKVPQVSLKEAQELTARMIADLRISDEGQEGMAAFLEKRKPNWVLNIKSEKNV
ncbi:MAG: enoyl-CoA hydratase/isomerase family protein [Candidatus Aminicenantes bacterium]|nr:enoyl-CoA hydratase/isomerase family protein [Candidatus Aminicenantes bacterium]